MTVMPSRVAFSTFANQMVVGVFSVLIFLPATSGKRRRESRRGLRLPGQRGSRRAVDRNRGIADDKKRAAADNGDENIKQ